MSDSVRDASLQELQVLQAQNKGLTPHFQTSDYCVRKGLDIEEVWGWSLECEWQLEHEGASFSGTRRLSEAPRE